MHNHSMDEDELSRIIATLETAIAQARQMAKTEEVASEEFDELVLHARQMHDLLVGGLAANPELDSPRMRGLAEATGNAADELDAARARLAGQLH